MLDIAAAKQGDASRVERRQADALALPFADQSFDAVACQFGVMFFPDKVQGYREARRVLRTGGRFLCLEFSEVDVPLVDRAYAVWSFNAIPRIGQLIAGAAEPYSYLVESIRKFPNQASFAAMVKAAGFERVTWRNYSGGIAALHSGWKL